MKKYLITLILVACLSGCKKEDLAVKFTGKYSGVATAQQMPDYSTVITYPDCRLTISEINRKTIRLVIVPDPADPTTSIVTECKINSATEFGQVTGARGAYTIIVQGKLQGSLLDYKNETSGYGPSKFTFKGNRQ